MPTGQGRLIPEADCDQCLTWHLAASAALHLLLKTKKKSGPERKHGDTLANHSPLLHTFTSFSFQGEQLQQRKWLVRCLHR